MHDVLLGYLSVATNMNDMHLANSSAVDDAHHYNCVFLFKQIFNLLLQSFSSYVGDAGNTSLVDAGTPLGATAVVTQRSAGYLLWECCILASL